MKDYQALSEGKEFDRENIKGFYEEMAKNIVYEKQRIGELAKFKLWPLGGYAENSFTYLEFNNSTIF